MALVFDAASPSRISNISEQLTTNWISIGAVAPELPNNLVAFVQSFEIKAHFAAREPSRALDLIRRAWGWYLNHPDGTASTCIEGYLADGSFGYRDTAGYAGDYSYTSHAHGWGTGPTHALTSYVVGLTFTAPAGSSWQISPQFGGLTHAEAGFTSPLGTFQAAWTTTQGGYTVSWSVPAGTLGVLMLPAATQPSVVLDGDSKTELKGSYNATLGLFTFSGAGGSHSATVTY